ncbi:calcium ion binding protein [Aureococcus anophagefferens]|nr:calcium ion binding protein [Aureococcus anophagefferens]
MKLLALATMGLASALDLRDEASVDELMASPLVRHVPASGAPRALDPSFLAALLGDATPWAEPLVHLTAEGGAPAPELGSYAAVAAAVAAGDASAVLRLERLAEPAAAVAALLDSEGALAGELERGASAHVYWSGPGVAALDNHTDPGEVLVVQLNGTKDWLVCPPAPVEEAPPWAAEAAAKLSRCATYDDLEMGARDCDVLTLRAGDALLLPPRTVHSARAASGTSVHVTIQRPFLEMCDDVEALVGEFHSARDAWAETEDGARRRRLQTGNQATVWASDTGPFRTGNTCNAGTYGANGYTCGSCNRDCEYYSESCSTTCDGFMGWSGCDTSCVTTAVYESGCDAECGSCSSCPECDPGTYQPYAGQATCYSCPAGSYGPSIGLTSCTSCEVGRYAVNDGSCSCTACEPGTYSGSTGGVVCASCAAGTYQTDFEASADESCPDDGDACSGGIESCSACPAGTYPHSSDAYCVTCDAGTYSPGGLETCTTCPAGAYCEAGSSEYATCSAGSYSLAGSAANGAATCASCAAGTYLEDDGLDETLHDNVVDCVDCAAGTYSGTGASSCDACAAGTYSGTGASGCSVCAAGYYVAFEAQASCTPCASGTYNADDGTDAALHDSYADCSSCAAGTYSTGGAEDCASCAAGTFAGGEGNAECTVCRAGRYVDSAGASACSLCPAQTFLEDAATDASSHDELGDCADCAAGLFCAGGGCDECTDCELCTNENQAPTFAVGDATLDLGAVDENGGPAALGELGCSDIDGDSLQYVITAGDDAGLFSAAHNVLSVAADAGLDYETATSYTLTIVATETDTEEAYSATVTVLVTVNDVNDVALTSVSQSTLSVVGGETVVISGANLGPYGDSAGVAVTMTYGNGADGATYYAYGCSVTTPGTEITCSTDEGVGALHHWTATIAAPGTSAWTATGAFTTSYAAPTISGLVTDGDFDTAGGGDVTLEGTSFGPRCDGYCGDGEKACGGACVGVSETCAAAPSDDTLCGSWLEDTVLIYYAAEAADLGSTWACAAYAWDSADGTRVACETSPGYGATTYWVAIIGVSGAATQYVGTTAEYNAESLGLAYGAAAVDVVVVAPDAAPYGYEGDLTFDDCAAACAGAGATMPCVANAEQNLALATRLHDDGFTNAWLGYDAFDDWTDADADWTWFDGCGSSFSYWSENEPNDSSGLEWHATMVGSMGYGASYLKFGYWNDVQGTDAWSCYCQTSSSPSVETMPTEGGSRVVLQGTNFGAESSVVSATYGGDDGARYEATGCAVLHDHTHVECVSAPGAGTGHAWVVTVAGRASAASAATVDYAPPTVTGVTGALTTSSTAGGATVYLTGTNFGPTGTEPTLSYGPAPGASLYAGDGACAVVVAHTKAACTTGPGVGLDHHAKLTVEGQTSPTYAAGLGYGSPYVTYYEESYLALPDREGFLAVGNETLLVHGGNFGTDDAFIDAVTYGPTGYEYGACTASSCGCVIHEAHEALQCTTVAAVGTGHRWKVVIAGQNSTAPSTRVEPPSVTWAEVVGDATEMAIGGGEVVRVSGANFGAEQGMVESVSYGPSGTEYAARNCTLVGDGRARTSEPGGSLSYATPEVFDLRPRYVPTAGGAVVVINGTDLGLQYSQSYVEVVVDGETIALDGDSLTRATPGGSDYTRACGAGLECVEFVVPAMADDDHVRAVTVTVGSAADPTIVLTSGNVGFEYEGPAITSLSTADGDAAGTVKVEIGGRNFGASSDYGSVYIQGAKVPSAQISSYAHDHISLTYLGGTTGALYVQLGDKASEEHSFEILSPRVVTEDSRFQPDADGYRTDGKTDGGEVRTIAVAGYHFSGAMEVWVGDDEVVLDDGSIRFGVQATIVGDLEVVDDVVTSLDIDDTCRKLTFEVPESGGSDARITVYSSGYPSYVANETADALSISYLPPTIDSVSATLVGTAGGDALTFYGDNFGPGEDAVTLGGVACTVVSWTHNEVVVSTPAGQGAGLAAVVTVVDQAASEAVAYRPPIIASVDPPSLSLANTGGQITITGSDFGLDPVISLPLDADRAVATSAVSHDHSTIVLNVGAGQGRNDLTINVGGQVAVEPYAYAAPVVAAVSPDEAATEGGVPMTITGVAPRRRQRLRRVLRDRRRDALFSTADGSLAISSYSSDAIALSSPAGEAPGPMTVVVTACGAVDDADSCVASGEDVTFVFSPPKIYYVAIEACDGSLLRPFAGCYVPEGGTEEVCVDATCDRRTACEGATLDGCGLRTTGGAEVVLFGANFGVSVPTIRLDGVAVDLVAHDASHSTHTFVTFVLPEGAGASIDVVVEAGGTPSEPSFFAYDPPCLRSVYPSGPDATGSVLTLLGYNFGETADAAGNVSVTIGDVACAPVSIGDTQLSLWQVDDGGGEPYIYCETPAVPVGSKAVNISAAGQDVSYAKEDGAISFACADDYYGQEAGEAFLTPDGVCLDYCVECPLGSACDKHGTSLHTVEPYALSGYYRLDLGDADYDVVCAEHREHRPFYCYDFSPCSPADARHDDGSKNLECWDDSGEPTLFYRTYGECVECPANQALMIAMICAAALVGGGFFYLLKKRKVEIAVAAIGVDYLQVLSVFAGTEIRWPGALKDFYRSLAIFNLDFLDIFPPECSFAVSYEVSWLAVEFAPVVLAAACYLVYLGAYVANQCKNSHNKREARKTMLRLHGKLASALLYGFYFIYLYIAENTLDVLNCGRVVSEDGARTEKEYLISDPSVICWTAGETQAKLYPVAIIFCFVYIAGYPALLYFMLRGGGTRALIFDDQLLRASGKGGHEEGLSPYLERVAHARTSLGLLYYRFIPSMPYWIVVVVLRKACLAFTTIMFHSSASFQLAVLLLILFCSLVLQMRNLPYSSPALAAQLVERNPERIANLVEEEKASPMYKDQAMRDARARRTSAR